MLSNEQIILQRLIPKDAEAFHALYAPQDKKPLEFAEHIASLCDDIFTIRTIDNPTEIIGGCALHHWDEEKKEIEIGGTLMPQYWGKGIMASAFQLLTTLARQEYGVDKIIAKAEITNVKALKFAGKMGFKKADVIADTVLLEKRFKKLKLSERQKL